MLGFTQRAFELEGHHFALVHITRLPDEGNTPYEVALDGERVWPPEGWDWPSSCLRTIGDDHGLRIAFGSCRCTYPDQPPWTLTKDADPRGREHDALRALALRMRDADPDEWPDLLLMLGDQVYADEVSPATERFIRARRDLEVPPGLQIADYEEYCHLYQEAWSEPAVRWLLSTVPSAMIFDDHDVIDDWNISSEWVADARAADWWDERVVGAFMSSPAPAGAIGATSGARSWWSWTPAQAACSISGRAPWSTRRSGTTSSSGRRVTSTTC